MKLLFELSGEHPELPVAELECIGNVIEQRTQVAVAICPDPAAATRLALTHAVLEYLGECDATTGAFVDTLESLDIATQKTFAARAKKVHGSCMAVTQPELERLMGTHITGRVSLDAPEEEYRVICSEDRCYFGRVLHRIDRGGFAYRNPLRRPFFHPGVMMPTIARALVNISLIRPGELLLDPFCGTGGVLLEGHLIGTRVLGSDADPVMVLGSQKNLPTADLMRADATALPLCDATADAVVTDLPYGQSVKIRARSMNHLYEAAFGELRRVLKPKRRALVVTHRDVGEIARGHFTVRQEFSQRVHKSLTRRILVLE